MKIYLDTETAGIYGDIFLIQYAATYKDVRFIRHTELGKIKSLFKLLIDPNNTVVGYNLKFDLWKLYQLQQKLTGKLEPFKCHTIDLYAHILTSKPISDYPVMGKKMIVIKKIPNKYIEPLIEKISEYMQKVLPRTAKIVVKKSKFNEELTTLTFGVELSKKLKELAPLFSPNADVLHIEEVFVLPEKDVIIKNGKANKYVETEDPVKLKACFDTNVAILNDPKSKAWDYAKYDIDYLFELEAWLNKHNKQPVQETYNDVVTHVVAYTKAYGFGILHDKVDALTTKTTTEIEEIKSQFDFNIASAPQRLKWLQQYPDGALLESASKEVIQSLLEEYSCRPEGVAPGLIDKLTKITKYGTLNIQLNQLKFLQRSKRLHVELNVIGTSTGRSSGGNQMEKFDRAFNAQGVSAKGDLRSCIQTSFVGNITSAEIVIAANYFKDEMLLKTQSEGYDFHMLSLVCFADDKFKQAFPLIDFNDKYKAHWQLHYIHNEGKGEPVQMEQYEKFSAKMEYTKEQQKLIKHNRNSMKRINFGLLYFCTTQRIANTLKITEEEAQEKLDKNFFEIFPFFKKVRDQFERDICTMNFSTWHLGEMKDHVENVFGTRRSIKFFKGFIEWLYDNLDNIASVAKGDSVAVLRNKEKKQLPYQAIRSALLGCLSYVQRGLYRQLGNYPIQSTCAEVTKMLQAELWQNLHIPMLNVHDEIDIPDGFHHLENELNEIKDKFMLKMQEKLKYLRMDFGKTDVWSDKK